MAHSEHDNLIWQTAMRWVLLEHENSLSDRTELTIWLNEAQTHRTAYEEALTLWLITGLIPPLTLEETEQNHSIEDSIK